MGAGVGPALATYNHRGRSGHPDIVEKPFSPTMVARRPSQMSNRIVVTGASGSVGRRVTDLMGAGVVHARLKRDTSTTAQAFKAR